MASFQETVLKLEGKCATACDLFAIMDQFRKLLITKADNGFFGMKVKLAIWKNYLPQPTVQKFMCEALACVQTGYKLLAKWFKFDKSPYIAALSIHNASKPPTLDDILKIWMQTTLKEKAPQNSQVCTTK